MSTYQNAFFVSDFEFVSNEELKHESETLIRVIAVPDWLDKVQYSLISTTSAVRALQDYLGTDYEIEKLDLFVIPEGISEVASW
jgi:aminopeptidase N